MTTRVGAEFEFAEAAEAGLTRTGIKERLMLSINFVSSMPSVSLLILLKL
jgi:hypothetical protein